MQKVRLEKQEHEAVDEATIAAIEAAQISARNGENMTLEQAEIYIEKQMEAWRKAQKKEALPA